VKSKKLRQTKNGLSGRACPREDGDPIMTEKKTLTEKKIIRNDTILNYFINFFGDEPHFLVVNFLTFSFSNNI
jgi:hypothetical protein